MYLDDGVAVAHHCDEKVQEDDDVDHRVGAEHQQAPETSVALDP